MQFIIIGKSAHNLALELKLFLIVVQTTSCSNNTRYCFWISINYISLFLTPNVYLSIFKTDCSSSYTSYFSRIFEYFGVYKLVLSHNSIYALRIHSVRTLFMAATFTCASHAAEQLQQQRGRWRRRHLNGATTTMAAATTSCLSPTKNAKSMRHNRKSKSINGNDKAREKLIEWQTCKVLVWKWRRLNARDEGGAARGVVVWQVYKNVLTAG